MSVNYPRDLDLIESPRGNAIQSTIGSLLGFYISDWMILLAGVGIAAAIVLIA